MNQVCDPAYCSGCSACANICPKSALQMQPDYKGFLRPVINSTECVECGLCVRMCPQNSNLEVNNHSQVFAGLAINDRLRVSSSSGGIFSLLAEATIKKNGVVFGAALGKDMTVRHIMIDSLECISVLRGSKYVQSDIGITYKQAKEQLAIGRPVLFSGTPCQIDALNHYIENHLKDNLLTVDILCHGVPSPAVFRKFLERGPKKCISVNFRLKDPGWDSFSTELTYEDGGTEIDNSYYYFFNGSYCLRDSCYRCKYSNFNRVGDISLGDFWGYHETAPEYLENDDLGISFISVNTNLGQTAMEEIKRKTVLVRRTMVEAAKGNPILLYPPIPNNNCDAFWTDFPNLSWAELVDKYHISRDKRNGRLSRGQQGHSYTSFMFRHVMHKIVKKVKSFLRALGGLLRK